MEFILHPEARAMMERRLVPAVYPLVCRTPAEALALALCERGLVLYENDVDQLVSLLLAWIHAYMMEEIRALEEISALEQFFAFEQICGPETLQIELAGWPRPRNAPLPTSFSYAPRPPRPPSVSTPFAAAHRALKAELDALRRASKDAFTLLAHIYSRHPPHRPHVVPSQVSAQNVKKALLNALRDYHPDRCRVTGDDDAWTVLCVEITKALNERHDALRYV